VGDGTSGSASIVTTGSGVYVGDAGTGILNISDGGVVEAQKGLIYLGRTDLYDNSGTAMVNISGAGSILRTTQGSEGETWERDGGRIYVGFHGASSNVVNITDGGSMEALSGSVGDSGDDGSIYIGTGATGSTAIVNVDGEGSSMIADNYISVGGLDEHDITAQLNITNGASVEVADGYPGEDNSTIDMWVDAYPVDSEASVTVNGNGSTLTVDNLKIGGTTIVVGYTANGTPVEYTYLNEMVVGEQVSDEDGNLLYDREGNPVVAVETDIGGGYMYTMPNTTTDEYNTMYVKDSGSVVVENEAAIYAETIDISENKENALAYNNQDASLTVRDGGTVYSDVNVFEGGALNGDGAIVGNVTVDGGTISPGNSPGTLIIDGDVELLSGFEELEAGDVLSVSGDLTLGSDFVFKLLFDTDEAADSGWMDSEGIYSIDLEDFFEIDGSLIVADDFSLEDSLEIIGLADGQSLTICLLEEQVTLTGSPVPVPAAIWLLGTGFFGLVGLRRKLGE
jgi:T5SS/PEP-CTERM-associated repeat protein